MIRIWLYGMLLPGLLGIAALAAIVLPGPGSDLTLTRLLTGCGVMITIQIGGGYLGGRAATRR